MAPAGDPLAAELSVPGVGRRDGVGVCSTGGMTPEIEVGGEEVIKVLLCSTGGMAPGVDIG